MMIPIKAHFMQHKIMRKNRNKMKRKTKWNKIKTLIKKMKRK